MKKLKYLISIILLFTIFSCSTQSFIFNKKLAMQVNEDNPSFTETADFVFGGIQQKRSFNPIDMCREKNQIVAKVDFVQTLPNVAITFATLGIYAPRDVKVYCINRE